MVTRYREEGEMFEAMDKSTEKYGTSVKYKEFLEPLDANVLEGKK